MERGEYCGGLCIEDPQKRNPQIFHADGRLKTFAERGLSLTDEERKRAQQFVRGMGTGVTPPVTQTPLTVTQTVTERTVVTESVTEALTPAERARRYRERKRQENKHGK
jgi:hypothetical protein